LAQRTGHHGGMSLGADLGTSLEMWNPEIGGQTFVCKNDKKNTKYYHYYYYYSNYYY
jgi:hypothetical protein